MFGAINKVFLLLVTIACATPIPSASKLTTRDANAVYNDILGIHYAVLNLTAAVTAYEGGILPSRPVVAASIAIHAVNRQGYADATASTPFSVAASKRIADAVTTTVAVSIPASVKIIEAKKPLFDQAELSSLIETTIELLKFDHETFSAAVAAKLTSAQVEAAAGVAVIEAALVDAVAYYAA